MAKNPSAQSINGIKLRKRHPPKVGTMSGKNSKMNHEHRQVANSILSRLKDGEQFSQSVIRTALQDAGDLASDRGEGLDQAVQEEDQGGGQSRGIGMVASNLIRLSEKTWAESCGRLAETHE
jgi:hypothetical protein